MDYNIAHHVLIIFCILMISFNLSIVKVFNRFFENIPSIHFNSSVLSERFRDFKASTCLYIFPHNYADIFATSLLILYSSFSSLILLSIVMISFNILSKGYFLKCKGYLRQE